MPRISNPSGKINLALLAFMFSILCLSACPRPQTEQKKSESVKDASAGSKTVYNELYINSVKQLMDGDYKAAYDSYQGAVEGDPGMANLSHLSNILYSWVISQSEDEDLAILTAQRRLLFTPLQMSVRKELLLLAVDRENDTIQVFGVGTAPRNVVSIKQKRLMAREAALTRAYAWIACLAMWTKTGVEGPFNVSQKIPVLGANPVKELWIGEEVFAIKVEAPLQKNIP